MPWPLTEEAVFDLGDPTQNDDSLVWDSDNDDYVHQTVHDGTFSEEEEVFVDTILKELDELDKLN